MERFRGQNQGRNNHYDADDEYEESDYATDEKVSEYYIDLAFSRTGNLSNSHIESLEELSRLNTQSVDNCVYTAFRAAKFLETNRRYKLISSRTPGGKDIKHMFDNDITGIRSIIDEEDRGVYYVDNLSFDNLLSEVLRCRHGAHAIVGVNLNDSDEGHAFNIINDTSGIVRYIDTSDHLSFRESMYNSGRYLEEFDLENQTVEAIVFYKVFARLAT